MVAVDHGFLVTANLLTVCFPEREVSYRAPMDHNQLYCPYMVSIFSIIK